MFEQASQRCSHPLLQLRACLLTSYQCPIHFHTAAIGWFWGLPRGDGSTGSLCTEPFSPSRLPTVGGEAPALLRSPPCESVTLRPVPPQIVGCNLGALRGMLMIEMIERIERIEIERIEMIENAARPGTPAALRVEDGQDRQHDDDVREDQDELPYLGRNLACETPDV